MRCSTPGSTQQPLARWWPSSRPRASPSRSTARSILVDSAARDRIRMALAAKGLPAGGPAGYEILDNLSGFGTTSQMFDAAYWRAKEGELARTITGSPNVRSARVHLANPVSQPFSADAGRLRLGHRHHGPRRARPWSGRGDPLSGLIRRCRHRAGGGGGDRRGARRGARRQGGPAQQRPGEPERAATETMRVNIQRLLEARVGAGARRSSRSTSTPTWTARPSASAPSTPTARWRSARKPRRKRENAQGTNPERDGGEQPSRRRRRRQPRARTRATRRPAASGRTSRFPRPSASA